LKSMGFCAVYYLFNSIGSRKVDETIESHL
jgi:hypothetical protein